MTTLPEIMPPEDSWDWFGRNLKGFRYEIGFFDSIRCDGLRISLPSTATEWYYSFPDLLANPSFCRAVWGDDVWHIHSSRAFGILRDEGVQPALEYIKKTKI